MKAPESALLGSLASATAATGVLTIYDIAAHDGQSLDFLQAMFGFWVLAFIVNATIALTFGLLWHRLVLSRGWTSAHAYWLPAVAVGGVPPFVLMILPLLQEDAVMPEFGGAWGSTLILLLGLGALLGGLTAVFAWLIRRPDRDAPNPPTSQP